MPPPADRAFLGHPRGLAILAATEGCIGFSFYGMQSLLVLYLTQQLLTPAHLGHVLGFGWFRRFLALLYGPVHGQPLASAIMGLYTALAWGSPIAGGLVADRLLGRTRTIVLGAALMTAGHFLLAWDTTFLAALLCLIVGMGCAKTLAAQVGALYALDDPRRADAFQIYELTVAVAVILAPLICGTLGEDYAWSWGFAAAGTGMLIGLLLYLAGRRWLPPEPPPRSRTARVRPTPAEARRLCGLVLLLPVLAVASVGNMQIFNAYLVWGAHDYALVFFGRTMPISWLLSLDALISTFTILGSIRFWRWWSVRHGTPHELTKLAIGAGISALAPLVLAAASLQAAGGHKVGLAWGVAFHVVNDIGFANVFAIGLALYSRLAPPGLNATVVNGYALSLFLSNLLVGWLGGLLGRMSGAQFWLLHAALVGSAAVVLGLTAAGQARGSAPGPRQRLAFGNHL